MDYFFLTIIILLGVITSYEDFKLGKIRNLWVGLALLSGLFLYIFIFFTDKISGINLSQIILNTFISSLVGFSLWRARAWSAGDAKLFIAYAFLLPFGFYAKTFLPIFPAFVIILNAFLLVLFYLLIKAVGFWAYKFVHLKTHERSNFFTFDFGVIRKYFFGLGKILPPFLLFMTLLAFLYTDLNQKFSIKILWFQIVAILAFIMLAGILARFYQNKYTHRLSLLLFIFLTIYGLDKNFTEMKIFLNNLFWGSLVFIIIFPLLHRLIEYYLEEVRGHEIVVNELLPGMILKKKTLEILGLPASSTYSFIGMNPDQLIQVKTLAEEKKVEKVIVGRPFYFAFWLFVGVLMTIALQGSILRIF